MKLIVSVCLLSLLITNSVSYEENHHKRSHHALKHSKHAHLSKNREANNCRWVCDAPGSNGTSSNGTSSADSTDSVLLIWTDSTVSYVNTTAKVGAFLNLSSTVSGYFCNYKKVAFVIDIKEKALFELRPIDDFPSNTSEDYLKIITWIQDKFSSSKDKFNKTAITNETAPSDDFKSILSRTGFGTPNVSKLVEVTEKALSILNASEWKLLFKAPGSATIPRGDVWFKPVLGGLVKIVRKIGISSFNGTQIDLAEVLKGSDALEILYNFFKQLQGKVDLSKLIDASITPESILELLHDLGGGDTSGVNGIINLWYNIALLIRGKGSISDLTEAVIALIKSTQNFPEIIRKIESSIEKLVNILREQSKNSSSEFLKFFQNLSKGNLIIDGFNLSEILKLLSSGNPNIIDILIKIVQRFSWFKPEKLQEVFHSILKQLNSTKGFEIISHLIPGFDLSKYTGNLDNFLQSALKGFNISQALSNGGNISSIPVIGDIYKQFANATGGSLDIAKLFSGSGFLEGLQNILGGGLWGDIGKKIEQGIGDLASGNVSHTIEGFLPGIFNASGNISSSIQGAGKGAFGLDLAGALGDAIKGSVSSSLSSEVHKDDEKNSSTSTATTEAQTGTTAGSDEQTGSTTEESAKRRIAHKGRHLQHHEHEHAARHAHHENNKN